MKLWDSMTLLKIRYINGVYKENESLGVFIYGWK